MAEPRRDSKALGKTSQGANSLCLGGEAGRSGASCAPKAGGSLGSQSGKERSLEHSNTSGVFQASASLLKCLGQEGDAAGQSSTHRKSSSTASTLLGRRRHLEGSKQPPAALPPCSSQKPSQEQSNTQLPTSSAPDLLLGLQLINPSSSGKVHRS